MVFLRRVVRSNGRIFDRTIYDRIGKRAAHVSWNSVHGHRNRTCDTIARAMATRGSPIRSIDNGIRWCDAGSCCTCSRRRNHRSRFCMGNDHRSRHRRDHRHHYVVACAQLRVSLGVFDLAHRLHRFPQRCYRHQYHLREL